jgi:hypothetical protein
VVVVALGTELFTPAVSPELPDALGLDVEPELDELIVPEPLVPGAPMALVLPDVLEFVSVLAVLDDFSVDDVLPIALVLPGVPEGEVLAVLGELVDVSGVVAAVLSRLVQAPSDTAATSASAAQEMVVFMGNSLWLVGMGEGRLLPPSLRL